MRLQDCYELHKSGLSEPGEYWIDPTGRRELHSATRVQCLEDGWMTILNRGQYGNPEVKY